jgi:hypothetical protein
LKTPRFSTTGAVLLSVSVILSLFVRTLADQWWSMLLSLGAGLHVSGIFGQTSVLAGF